MSGERMPAASPVPVVFDHFGGAQAALGTGQPGFADLVELVKSGKAYVKISGAYRAWALTPDELILYLPDYPVAHDTPLNYDPLTMQWSMDGGNVQVHVPQSALAGVLKPQYGG